jgi:hypothetical protein
MAKGTKQQTEGQDVPEVVNADAPGTSVAVSEAPAPAGLAATASSLPARQTVIEDEGAGLEDIGREELAIPFVNLLQKGSPQVDQDKKGEFIEGARPGMAVNSVTRELYDTREKGIIFIPVHRVHQFLNWIPRDDGGGLAGVFTPDDEVVRTAKRKGPRDPKKPGLFDGPDGNDLVETFTVYGLLVDEDGGFERVAMSFSSTNVKSYRQFITMATSLLVEAEDGSKKKGQPPLFSHRYLFKSKFNENESGTWYTWVPTYYGGKAKDARMAKDDDLYVAARSFRQMVVEGAASADPGAMGPSGPGADSGPGSDEF